MAVTKTAETVSIPESRAASEKSDMVKARNGEISKPIPSEPESESRVKPG
jgi:hypothetical protein